MFEFDAVKGDLSEENLIKRILGVKTKFYSSAKKIIQRKQEVHTR